MTLKAVVIGAGLAGTAVARALGRRGVKVTMIDSGSAIAAGASGNPAGIVLPHLAIESNPTFRFSTLGRKCLLNVLSESLLTKLPVAHDLCGVLSLARHDQELTRMERALESGGCPSGTRRVSPSEASQFAGVEVQGQGVFFSEAGWVDPVSLCEFNLQHVSQNIETLLCAPVHRIHWDHHSETWFALNQQEQVLASAGIFVIANGFDCKNFPQTAAIPLFKVRGQLESVEANKESKKLRTVISYGGYVTPSLKSNGGCHVAGATFNWKDLTDQARPEDTQEIMEGLSKVVSGFGQSQDFCKSRVSFRATSPDTLPMIGQVCDPHSPRGKMQSLPGLYVSVGHGSRGLLYSQIAGEILGAQICNEPLPIPQELVPHLEPSRFLKRQWNRSN